MNSKTYTLINEDDPQYKIEFDVNFLGLYTVRGYYNQRFQGSVLLVEEVFEDIHDLLDEEKFGKLIIIIHEKMVKKRDLLINVNNMFEKSKKYKI
ncbi:MAG: hypothetical protein WC996_06695 [Peptostreptococcales bacterium]